MSHHATLACRRFLLAAAAALPLAWGANQAHAQDAEYTLRLHHFFPASAPVHQEYFLPWKEAIEKESSGRIDVQLYPSMQLGGTPPALYDQAKDGQVDIIWTVLGYNSGRFPKAEVFDLPFLPTSGAATSQAAHEYAMTHMQDELEGVHPIAVHTHSPGALHTKETRIEALEDIEGLKMRGPSRLVNRYLAKLGAEPIGMPVAQALEALSRGVIDGTVIPFEAITAMGLADITTEHTIFSGDRALYTTMMIVAMDQDKYDALPEDLQAVIDAHSGAREAYRIGQIMDQADHRQILAIQSGAQPGTITRLDREETARWQAIGQEVVDEWIAEAEARGLDGQALYDDARRLVERYTR
ncbi:TRAP-type C4-dicarboxylate transport system substrate-binding protein [Chromohalobacter marismortui]|uniref:TRAP-type C4-dicarboxylate transport system substrate-binding protein n=1 Tax=Chromohalobacter marismortui TaxID=42055 RepID=A0A4R7NMB7_9GAMM|nr:MULTISPECIES: TRAP transporter substrate-binding protein [Chromohalobacter]MCI0509732.1 TRAP transporter substrate-binding protein [Chromohalobacter sp.]MCI0593305.1 TRAP transporter substrate-binding protein [Chromohalobacter sp.]TDU21954.1 TRAP-type C4-dicarboxylate transport system substrate-binding protein [Chromohalobacter marismortui]